MNDHLLTIGQLARRVGLPVRTIRFWSDADIVPPVDRSPSGYRLYDAESVVRVDLVRTLRELGLDLGTVARILSRQTTVADVARAHVHALDAEIRALRLRRAVLQSVARRGSTTEEMRLVHRLARLSARERQRIIDDFVDETFAGVDPNAPGARIAASMRQLPAELPEDPTPEQVDAWVELAELVADPAFRERTRQMALAGARQPDGDGDGDQPVDPAPVLEHAGGAVRAGVRPESHEGRTILHRIIDPATPGQRRIELAEQIALFTDRRVERYWQLASVLNGWPPAPASVPAFEWFVAALRAHSD